MKKGAAIRIEDLTDNGGPFLPVCLCLDTSMSMQATLGGRPTGEYAAVDGIRGQVVKGGVSCLELLQDGIQQFYDTVFSDEMARCTVEIAIVTFDDYARQMKRFSRVEYMKQSEDGRLVSAGCWRLPKLEAKGEKTAMGEGINLALDLLENCKEDYSKRGLDSYQPWLVIMSDGKNNGSDAAFTKAQGRIRDLVNRNKLAVYPLAIGHRADLQQLNALSPKQEAFRVQAPQIRSLFRWLAQSSKVVSSGELGQSCSPKLERFEVVGWAKGLM